MPTYYARSSGNVNGTIWATTPTGTASNLFSSFTSGDVLVSNSFTVTLNVDTNLGPTGEVRNDATGGATASGSFTLNNAVTLTANIFCGVNANCVNTSGSASAAIIGNVNGSAGSSVFAVNHNSNGTLTITGGVAGGSGVNANAVNNASSGTITITGNVTGGTGGGGNQASVINSAGGVVNITGAVTGGANTNSFGASNSASGTMNITGNVTGGAGNVGAVNNLSGTLSITGTASGAAQAGANNQSNGIMNVTRAKGGPLSSSAVGVIAASGSSTTVDEIEYGDLGMSPTSGPIRLADKTSNVAVMYRFGTTKKTLVDTASTSLVPAASNVRSGVVYNAGQSTGTCAVPSAASVLVGVAVDNTVGTAAVSSAAIQSACNSALTAFSSGRLANVATVDSTGSQIAAAVGQ